MRNYKTKYSYSRGILVNSLNTSLCLSGPNQPNRSIRSNPATTGGAVTDRRGGASLRWPRALTTDGPELRGFTADQPNDGRRVETGRAAVGSHGREDPAVLARRDGFRRRLGLRYVISACAGACGRTGFLSIGYLLFFGSKNVRSCCCFHAMDKDRM